MYEAPCENLLQLLDRPSAFPPDMHGFTCENVLSFV